MTSSRRWAACASRVRTRTSSTRRRRRVRRAASSGKRAKLTAPARPYYEPLDSEHRVVARDLLQRFEPLEVADPAVVREPCDPAPAAEDQQLALVEAGDARP